MTTALELKILNYKLAVCQLPLPARVPAWASAGRWWAVNRTDSELSIVAEDHLIPPEAVTVSGWRALEVQGPLDFALTGILAAIAQPLAAAGISIFAISTFDTDYVLIQATQLKQASDVLRAAGHTVTASRP